MSKRIFLPVYILGIAIGGCSIHPLPEDTARDSTFDIVKKIRCEAREAIATAAGEKILTLGELKQELQEISSRAKNKEKIKADVETYAKTLLSEGFKEAAIGYDFQFTINEGNSAEGSTTFAFPFSNGKALFTVGLGETKDRKSDRSFDLVEKFWELMVDPEAYCETGPAWRYPITGSIGLDEVVRTYIKLQRLGSLEKTFKKEKTEGSSGGGGASNISAFTDVLTFTTSYSGGVDASLEVNPVVHDLRLTKASASLGGDRKDIHKVTIGFVKEFDIEKKAPKTAKVKKGQNLYTYRLGPSPLAPPTIIEPASPSDTKAEMRELLQRRRNEGAWRRE